VSSGSTESSLDLVGKIESTSSVAMVEGLVNVSIWVRILSTSSLNWLDHHECDLARSVEINGVLDTISEMFSLISWGHVSKWTSVCVWEWGSFNTSKLGEIEIPVIKV